MKSTHTLFSAPALGKLMLPMKILVVVFAPLLSLAGATVGNQDTQVTAVEGKSWINQIHTTFNESAMGSTWRLGPPPPVAGEKPSNWQLRLSPSFATRTLTGSDVYRLNCRGCHQETGLGAPPEINSIIDPVRATSVGVIVKRMQGRGMEISPADAAVLAKEANAVVLKRLHEGGTKMPAFPQLSPAEIRALIPYLKQLAGVPGADREANAVIEATPLHVGELVVKSTCHICHDAVGPNPSPQQLLDGARPPLSTLTTRTNLPQFVQKVTQGAPITMGAPALLYRGRMSVFHYLSQDEAASAYLYLTCYPPQK
jgi:mono/diheme cytochrome c family protein